MSKLDWFYAGVYGTLGGLAVAVFMMAIFGIGMLIIHFWNKWRN